MTTTKISNHVFKHCFVVFNGRNGKLRSWFVLFDEFFHLGAIVQLQQSSGAPHQTEEEQAGEMLRAYLALVVILLRYQACLYVLYLYFVINIYYYCINNTKTTSICFIIMYTYNGNPRKVTCNNIWFDNKQSFLILFWKHI